jgi:hypothetical protein
MARVKLLSISFGTTPRLPSLRPTELGRIDCLKPSEALKNWRLILRGQQAFFVSPPGWVPDLSIHRHDPNGPVTVHELPRAELLLQWQATDAKDLEDVFKSGKYESPPFGWTPAPVEADKPILAQVPAGQMGDA